VTLELLFRLAAQGVVLVVATMTSARAESDPDPLGPYDGSQFGVLQGHAAGTLTPAAAWYFGNEWVAIPKRGSARPLDGGGGASPPGQLFAWVAGPDHLRDAYLGPDGTLRHADASTIRFRFVPKLESNRAYYDASSTRYLAGRPLSMRGTYVRPTDAPTGSETFIARTIWPEHWRLPASLPAAEPGAPALHLRIERAFSAPPHDFRVATLWTRPGSAPATRSPRFTVGLMLNGAQGDDDEAHGGHFALTTGQLDGDGRIDHWLVNNFYGLDSVSEKGILAAAVPMDGYMTDVNSGQAWYRPSYLLVATFESPDLARELQAAMAQTFERFYAHDLVYDHARANCTGISLDVLAGLGWTPPGRGPTSRLKAIAGFYYSSVTDGSFASGRKTYRYLTEEQVRLYPRAGFEALGEDLLALVRGERAPRSPFETRLAITAQSIAFVEIPQIPSSRARGTAPAGSFDDYMRRVPSDRAQWKVIPVPPRPFPDALRSRRADPPFPSDSTLGLAATAGPLLLILGAWRWRRRRPRRVPRS